MKRRLPDWIKVKISVNENTEYVRKTLNNLSLNTVCEQANCPNMGECFGKRTATFMILGKVCTRNCTFCNVKKAEPGPLDQDEPDNVAEGVKALGLRHVVITSVTRDDLEDGGADHFVKTIDRIREKTPGTKIEVLIPDFKGNMDAIKSVAKAEPDVLNHNIETIERLYSQVRPMASYTRSLELLKYAKGINPQMKTKSGIMVGLGETFDEVINTLNDLKNAACEMVTIGQYLAPSRKHIEVHEFISPETFNKYKEEAYSLGFNYVASSPLVRSSYNASESI